MRAPILLTRRRFGLFGSAQCNLRRTPDVSHKPDSGPAPAVRNLVVGVEDEGQRIDNFLRRHLKGVPTSRIYRIVRRGEVRVNGGRIRVDYRLKQGDQVRIPPVRFAERSSAPVASSRTRAAAEAAIVYEDSHLIVLDKPAGFAVHGGSGVSYGVIEALRAARPTARFLELVHRLDRDTSGCLMVAKRRSALRALHDALRGGAVDKRYAALVHGQWPRNLSTVRAALERNVLRGGERIVRVSEHGKPAESRVRVLETLHGATLVEVSPLTGRTHQIRVHTAQAGHPIAGDGKYGDEEFNATMRAGGLRRLFLHACSLRFPAPWAETTITVEAPLHEELRTCLASLREEPNDR